MQLSNRARRALVLAFVVPLFLLQLEVVGASNQVLQVWWWHAWVNGLHDLSLSITHATALVVVVEDAATQRAYLWMNEEGSRWCVADARSGF